MNSLKPMAKYLATAGASALCGAVADKAMSSFGKGVTKSGDGRKKKNSKKGGCNDCTMKLKNHLKLLKL